MFINLLPLLVLSQTAEERWDACEEVLHDFTRVTDCANRSNQIPPVIRACGQFIGGDARIFECIKHAPSAEQANICADILKNGPQQVACLKVKLGPNARSCKDADETWRWECLRRGWNMTAEKAGICMAMFPEKKDPGEKIQQNDAIGDCLSLPVSAKNAERCTKGPSFGKRLNCLRFFAKKSEG